MKTWGATSLVHAGVLKVSSSSIMSTSGISSIPKCTLTIALRTHFHGRGKVGYVHNHMHGDVETGKSNNYYLTCV